MEGTKARRSKRAEGAAAFLFAAIISLFSQAYAQDISLPLEGYFHPGRAMPVKWDVSPPEGPGATIQVSASDSVTTFIWSNNQRGIMPWIAIDPNIGALHWRFSSGATGEISDLHQVDESDCLVGDFVTDDSVIGAFFPNRRVITVHLDAEDLRAPAMAWETLDVMLLTPQELQTLSPTTRGQLFAEGITVAVRDARRPDALLPWRLSGQWWIASSELKLPPMIDSGAYAPTEGWTAGRSETFRRRIVLLGAIYCLIACGACLWRSRWMPAAFVAMSVIAGAAFAFDNSRQSPIFQRSGTVLLNGDPTFDDNWVYQVSHRSADFRLLINGFIHPIFADENQSGLMKLRLDCDGDGVPIAIGGKLTADQPLALINRQVSAPHGEDFGQSFNNSPLIRLVGSVYPQFQFAGQLTESIQEDIWPTIVLSRR